MKILKYIITGFLLIIAISETLPIYLIALGLFHEQAGGDTNYLIGRLLLHVLYLLAALFIAYKFYSSAKRGKSID